MAIEDSIDIVLMQEDDDGDRTVVEKSLVIRPYHSVFKYRPEKHAI